MGKTVLSKIQCDELLSVLRNEWIAQECNLLRRNCAHFCNNFCQLLGVGGLPVWLMNLAGAASAIANAEAAVEHGCNDVAFNMCKCVFDAEQGAQECCNDMARCACCDC